MNRVFTLVIALLLTVSTLQAAYFERVPYTLRQPNGDTLACFITGDEFFHYLHDEAGFTIVKNPSSGFYMYAILQDDSLVASPYIAGTVSPQSVGLQPFVTISAQAWQARRPALSPPIFSPSPTRTQTTDTLHNLVVFIRFANEDDFTTNPALLYNMFNAPATNAVSLQNYYKQVSYNQLFVQSHFFPTPSGTTVLSYQDIYPRGYYCKWSSDNPIGYVADSCQSRKQQLLTRAIEAVRASIPASLSLDFNADGCIDNVCFVVKGNVEDWSDLLWPHQSYFYPNELYINGKRLWNYTFHLSDNPLYFSVSCLAHELFHSLGAPDLYHYDHDCDLTPVGAWDIMANNGTVPQHPSAHVKCQYAHWLDSIPTITESGTYTLFPLSSATGDRVAYRIASEIPSESFVVEFRKKTNFLEASLPGTGMLIYRINSEFRGNSAWDGSNYLDEVYIYRPSGTLTENGYPDRAHYNQHEQRTELSYATNPKPFLSNGYVSALRIYDICVTADSLTFKYLRPGDPAIISSVTSHSYQLFPNPATENVTLQTTNATAILKAELLDITGKFIAPISLDENKTFSIKEYPKGIYVLVITFSNGEKWTEKIICQ